MATDLIKPTAAALADSEQLLRIIMRMYDGLTALQVAAGKTSIVDLGALAADPGRPPPGVVYTYTIAGSLYARTATAPTLLAA